ncbi:MAG: hypothetical protein HC789_21615 [Microcoleus sp. CSU_2_2]|nr:hypothetical protein [Microcoleus sp. SU_5_3]NJS12783.1 hypothetical protein [Microcoleus sp. CSU_2_2]
MQATAQETNNTSLFTELTAEESASVNGGCRYSRRRYYPSRYGCRRPVRRHVVYRRKCDGSYRTVYHYW